MLATGEMGETQVYSKSRFGFFIMQFSFGYFMADCVGTLSDQELRKDRAMIAHHIVSIIGLFLGLYYQGKFMFFVVYRLITESSTPFVNLFVLLRILKKQNSKLFVVNSILMIISFFACRVYPIWWHWKVTISTHLDPEVVILPILVRAWTIFTYVVFDALNVFWFYKMSKGALKYFIKKDKKVVE